MAFRPFATVGVAFHFVTFVAGSLTKNNQLSRYVRLAYTLQNTPNRTEGVKSSNYIKRSNLSATFSSFAPPNSTETRVQNPEILRLIYQMTYGAHAGHLNPPKQSNSK